jgi:hypothetical protein
MPQGEDLKKIKESRNGKILRRIVMFVCLPVEARIRGSRDCEKTRLLKIQTLIYK